MLGFAETILAWLGATALPALFGLLLVSEVSRRTSGRYIAAFALGVFLWFFSDTIGGSAYLDVNEGFSGGVVQVALVALFVVGLFAFLSTDGRLFAREEEQNSRGFTVALLVALAIGLHGLGEGVAYGATAASTPSSSLLDAFGGLTAGVAYVMHKAIEPVMIGACYALYSRGRVRNAVGRLWDMLALAAVFVAPSLFGAFAGYYAVHDSTFFFALGTGASTYAALRLAKPLFTGAERSSTRDSAKVAVLMILGFLCIYLAALFHS